MTDRDAFILGVSTYCKTAEMDADDTSEFVSLLMSDPALGAAIIKRAQSDPELQKTAGSPLLLGALAATQWGGGKPSGGGKAGPPKAAQQPTTPFNQQQLDWLRSNYGINIGGGANGASGATGAAGRIPGTVGGWGAARGTARPQFIRMSPGGYNVPSGSAQEPSADAPEQFAKGIAPGGKNVETGSAEYPTATVGGYAAGLGVGLTDKNRLAAAQATNLRRSYGRFGRRFARRHGMSLSDIESMTPEQMSAGKFAPSVLKEFRGIQEHLKRRRGAAGGKPYAMYGGGFGMPNAKPQGAPGVPGAAPSPGAAGPRGVAGPTSTGPLPPSSPPTESQIGNAPTRSLTDPSVNPRGAGVSMPEDNMRR